MSQRSFQVYKMTPNKTAFSVKSFKFFHLFSKNFLNFDDCVNQCTHFEMIYDDVILKINWKPFSNLNVALFKFINKSIIQSRFLL